LKIEEHYTDTGGATDHVFGLCHLFGFRFAARIRDLKDRRLYLFPVQTPPPILDHLVGGFVDVHQITAHWNDLSSPSLAVAKIRSTVSAALLRRWKKPVLETATSTPPSRLRWSDL
jgi:TnpA family transposase